MLPGKQAFPVEDYEFYFLLLEGVGLDGELERLLPHGVEAGGHCLCPPLPRFVRMEDYFDKWVRKLMICNILFSQMWLGTWNQW